MNNSVVIDGVRWGIRGLKGNGKDIIKVKLKNKNNLSKLVNFCLATNIINDGRKYATFLAH